MKILSIRTKITLWYTMFMVILTGIILGILVEFADKTIFANQQKILVEAVQDAGEDIEEGEDFDYFEDGVYLIKYDENQNFSEGGIPERFSLSYPLIEGRMQSIKQSDEIFYVYDQKIFTERNEIFWIRGVIPNAKTAQLTTIVLSSAFILLPILVILSTVIGYFITKKAFLPVKKIQETAENITESNELSLRIGLPKGKDEISRLGKTIDKMLERVEKSFEKEKQFSSDVSHELRTPVSVILAESEYILKHGEDMDEARESMEIINRQAEKMSALINHLLFFSRAEQGRVQLKYEKIDVVQAVEELVKEISVIAKSKNILIEIENNLKNYFYNVDKILFIRAVQNVIQNGVSYGKENGHVNIKLYENNGFLVIEIKDDGIGISRENLEKIWDRFFQADEARSNQTNGSMGLGLSMVKLILEKHGGYVKAESVLGEGSKFTLFFPIKN